MKAFHARVLAVAIAIAGLTASGFGQCSVTSLTASTCSCQVAGATNCDLLPDIMISWYALQNSYAGPSEFSQTASSDAARLRVSGSTPNVGHGPLETRGVNAAGVRKFICGPDTFSTTASTFACPNGFTPRQILYQRVYHKNPSGTMTYTDVETGSMTYHATHGHQHVNDWSTMSLRLAQPGVSDPRLWPVLATGGKVGYCLINLFTCSGSPGYCKTSHLYNQGSNVLNGAFGNNYNLGFGDGCTDVRQGIKVGNGDTYSENLDGMWINLMPGLCNGQYQIVMDVDPNDDFLEENEENNYTWMPFNVTQQSPANSGGTANILSSGPLAMAPGDTRTLTASPGTAYAWSTGATTRSITITGAGTYSCTVTCPCGSLSTPSLTFTSLAAPPPPVGTGATVLSGTTAGLSATGSDLHWFDASSGGNEVGTGNNFTTPVLSSTTNYWVEARNTVAGANVHAGKLDNSGSGAYESTKNWLFFDAYAPFKLESFKVYASTLGLRHFVLVDRLGNLIAEKFIEIPSGLNTITVNWDVPAGTQHRITAYDDNSEVTRNLWRSSSGVSYPYAIGTLGSITGSSSAGMYYYLYDWIVKTNDVFAASARTMVTATVTDGVLVGPKVILEGPFNSGTGLMSDALRVAGLIPTTEPFTGLNFAHASGGGGEQLDPALLLATGANAIVDWVLLELRSAATPSQIVATRSALLTRSGQVIPASGGTLRLRAFDGNYYLAVRHRNHFGTMTAAPIALGQSAVNTDFSLSATATWGFEGRKVDSGVAMLWTGNVLRDQNLLYAGANNDRDPILSLIGGSIPTNTVSGYHQEDTNMDGTVKYVGGGNDRDPILSNIGGSVPTNVRVEQLP
ncbi:MAG: hypothetical protein IPL52_00885 [Flavobacteriales bacterium]|nr:hypothetical protein [Flavobacteriales bacterium]